MGILSPATPGFLMTLAATVMLFLVILSVPHIQSVYFLQASFAPPNQPAGSAGNITFGTLGYCISLANGTNSCTSPHVGWEIPNVNDFFGNQLPVKIPDVAVKWLTYTLVLNIVAFVLAAVSSIFGLLAHLPVGGIITSYCSGCISGFAASAAIAALVFDSILFFGARARLNDKDLQGSHAEMGNAIWLVIASAGLLLLAPLILAIGQCCACCCPSGRDKSHHRHNKSYDHEMGPRSIPHAPKYGHHDPYHGSEYEPLTR